MPWQGFFPKKSTKKGEDLCMVRGKRILKEWKLSTKDLCSKTKEKQKTKT